MANMTKNVNKTEDNISNEQTNQNAQIEALMARIAKLEEENSNKDTKLKNPKEKYKWPRTYSYKLWNWIPICDYVSKKKEYSRDYAYQNEKWVTIDNHLLVLKLANGKEVETLVTEFHKWYTKSEQIVPKKDKSSEWYVVFVWEDNKEFKVYTKILN